MARKGPKRSQKRLSATKAMHLLRKENTWTIRTLPGPHTRAASMPLGYVVRDMLGIAETLHEAKQVLHKGTVHVDGKPVKDCKRAVGLFDIVAVLAENKAYRVLFSRKGEFMLVEEKAGENRKLCRVMAKRAVKGGTVQITTNDGRSFREKKTDVNVGDTLLVSVPDQKVLQHFKMEKGNTVLFTGGRWVGSTAKIKGVVEATMGRPKLVTLENEQGEFQTVAKNVFVVGHGSPAINIKGEK
ncbi:MAG: 30S ribosomal protein S4e [Candidatus Diapherotrites archaeon]|nr:30S ribosomal protein S4e [Candidatus Diapherotrites archaeon]